MSTMGLCKSLACAVYQLHFVQLPLAWDLFFTLGKRKIHLLPQRSGKYLLETFCEVITFQCAKFQSWLR